MVLKENITNKYVSKHLNCINSELLKCLVNFLCMTMPLCNLTFLKHLLNSSKIMLRNRRGKILLEILQGVLHAPCRSLVVFAVKSKRNTITPQLTNNLLNFNVRPHSFEQLWIRHQYVYDIKNWKQYYYGKCFMQCDLHNSYSSITLLTIFVLLHLYVCIKIYIKWSKLIVSLS